MYRRRGMYPHYPQQQQGADPLAYQSVVDPNVMGAYANIMQQKDGQVRESMAGISQAEAAYGAVPTVPGERENYMAKVEGMREEINNLVQDRYDGDIAMAAPEIARLIASKQGEFAQAGRDAESHQQFVKTYQDLNMKGMLGGTYDPETGEFVPPDISDLMNARTHDEDGNYVGLGDLSSMVWQKGDHVSYIRDNLSRALNDTSQGIGLIANKALREQGLLVTGSPKGYTNEQLDALFEDEDFRASVVDSFLTNSPQANREFANADDDDVAHYIKNIVKGQVAYDPSERALQEPGFGKSTDTPSGVAHRPGYSMPANVTKHNPSAGQKAQKAVNTVANSLETLENFAKLTGTSVDPKTPEHQRRELYDFSENYSLQKDRILAGEASVEDVALVLGSSIAGLVPWAGSVVGMGADIVGGAILTRAQKEARTSEVAEYAFGASSSITPGAVLRSPLRGGKVDIDVQYSLPPERYEERSLLLSLISKDEWGKYGLVEDENGNPVFNLDEVRGLGGLKIQTDKTKNEIIGIAMNKALDIYYDGIEGIHKDIAKAEKELYKFIQENPFWVHVVDQLVAQGDFEGETDVERSRRYSTAFMEGIEIMTDTNRYMSVVHNQSYPLSSVSSGITITQQKQENTQFYDNLNRSLRRVTLPAQQNKLYDLSDFNLFRVIRGRSHEDASDLTPTQFRETMSAGTIEGASLIPGTGELEIQLEGDPSLYYIDIVNTPEFLSTEATHMVTDINNFLDAGQNFKFMDDEGNPRDLSIQMPGSYEYRYMPVPYEVEGKTVMIPTIVGYIPGSDTPAINEEGNMVGEYDFVQDYNSYVFNSIGNFTNTK